MSVTLAIQNVPLQVRFAGLSDVGLRRAHNEDSFFLPGSERLAIVADGMGGHASGEVASKMAIETTAAHYVATEIERPIIWPFPIETEERRQVRRLKNAIALANSAICEDAERNPARHGMGTTLVATYFMADKVLIGHVGDSRVYRFRSQKLQQLTDDHSLVNDYMRINHLSAEEAENFPHKNVIVRALGMKPSMQIDLLTDNSSESDVYLLCSDGLSGMVSDPGLAEILNAKSDLDEACAEMVAAANRAGGIDNVTCVLARVEKA